MTCYTREDSTTAIFLSDLICNFKIEYRYVASQDLHFIIFIFNKHIHFCSLQFIKSLDIEVSVDWIVDEAYKELFDHCPDINQVHIIKLKECKKKKSLGLLLNEFKKLRKLDPYDIVIDMQGLIKSAIVSKLIPAHTGVAAFKIFVKYFPDGSF